MTACATLSTRLPAELLSFIGQRAEPMWSRPIGCLEPGDETRERRLARWMETAAGGDRDRFDARLAMCGLSVEEAGRRVVAPPSEIEASESWLAFLAGLSFDPSARPSAGKGTDVAFGACFEPFLSAVQALIEQRLAGEGISGSELALDLAEDLRRRLSDTAGPVLQHRFSLFRQLHSLTFFGKVGAGGDELYRLFCARFTGGEWPAVLRVFPCLARLLGQICVDWVDALVALLVRLDLDRSGLDAAFAGGGALGSPVDIRPGLSDPHDGGRTVCLVSFDCGVRLIYKPRDIGIERAFNRLLARLNDLGAEPSFRIAGVLARDGCGWVDYIQPRPLQGDAQEIIFARQVGMLAAVLYSLDAVDCHQGNLVCDGEHPVLVDVETILHPRTVTTADIETAWDQQDPLTGFDPASVLRSGLIPGVHIDERDRSFVVGGVGATGGIVTAANAWTWHDLNTDAMSLTWNEPEAGFDSGEAMPATRAACYRHREALLEGFTVLFRLLNDQSRLLIDEGLIEDIARQERRFVPRATAVYWRFLHHALDPAMLRDGIDRSIELEALAACWIGRAGGQAFAEQERRAIERMDVPRLLVTGEQPATLSRSAEARIRALDDVDHAQQRAMLKEALALAEASEMQGGLPGDDSQVDLGGEARRIFDALLARAVPHQRGGRTWIGATLNGSPRRCDIVPVPSGLYAGQSGIALFLAAFHATNGDGAELAYDTLKPLRSGMAETGRNGLLGRSSVAYALLRCGTLLNDESLIAAALEIADGVSIENHSGPDLVAGDAGTILTLLPLYTRTRDETLRGRLRIVGERLRAAVMAGDVTGEGLAHGAAGPALALSRMGEVLEDEGLCDAAGHARGVASFQADAPRSSWCHGPTGLGLAGLQRPESPVGRKEIEAAVLVTQRFGAGPLDHLCCGTFGRVHFLAEAGRRLGDPVIARSAVELATDCVRQAHRNGGYRLLPGIAAGAFVPSFFQGISGIGYTLLRLTHPGELPDVLVLE